MTTPAEPDTAPRHARQRPAPAAAARNRQAARRAAGGRSGAAAGSAAGPEGAVAGYAAGKASDIAKGAARTVGQARIPGDRAYQPVLLAEFLAAVVIVALLPIATGGSDNAKVKGTPSPYDTGDLKQLAAIGGLYFILALASSGNSGRVSAWLGGLVLLGLAMKKLSGPLSGPLQDKLQGIKGGVAQFGKTAGGAV